MKSPSPLVAIQLALLCAGVGVAQEPQPGPARDSPARVMGVVVEIGTEIPVGGAAVRLTPTGGGAGEPGITDARGRFSFTDLAPGRYVLEIERLGYGGVRDSLSLESGARTLVSVELVPEALELDPIVVTTTPPGPDMGGFDERRQLGFGTFITREEIDRRSPSYASDIFRNVAGVQVVGIRGRAGAELRMRGGCRPDVVIDGILLRPYVGMVIDDYLSANDIEAIEVYFGSQTPPQFADSLCGAVVVWTRRGEPGVGSGDLSTRLLIATGLFLATVLLMR